MLTFANVFLLLFLADGSLSILHELVSFLAPVPALAAIRHGVAQAVILTASPIYLALGLDRRLPKRVFLPLVLFAWLCPLSLWLFPALTEFDAIGLFTAVAQLLVFLLATSPFWKKSGDWNFLMPAEALQGPVFTWKNTLVFSALNLFVTPLLLALMLLSTANAYMQKYTSGFVRLGPDGLHMIEKVYSRGDKTVRLAGMIHVGEKQYYQKVVQPQPGHRAIILAEGVTDERHLLQNRVDYGKVASYLGLRTQQEDMLGTGRVIKPDQLDQPVASQKQGEAATGEPDILRADVDLSTFHQSTIWFLNEVGRQMREAKSLRSQMLNSVAWSQKNVTPEMQQVITEDILYSRNKVLIRNLHKALEHYDVIIVPWGALHMAGIEADVLNQGFKLQQVNDRVGIHFMQSGRSSAVNGKR